jgi:hypothetical protein
VGRGLDIRPGAAVLPELLATPPARIADIVGARVLVVGRPTRSRPTTSRPPVRSRPRVPPGST